MKYLFNYNILNKDQTDLRYWKVLRCCCYGLLTRQTSINWTWYQLMPSQDTCNNKKISKAALWSRFQNGSLSCQRRFGQNRCKRSDGVIREKTPPDWDAGANLVQLLPKQEVLQLASIKHALFLQLMKLDQKPKILMSIMVQQV